MSVRKFLQLIGIVNVLFIAFNGSYQFSSSYFSNTTMVLVLLALTVLSFTKDIFDYVGVLVPYKPLDAFFKFYALLVPGILSSFIVLIPKLLLIESQHLDSMGVKFTVRINRLWDKSELSAYLTNLVEERGVSYLITETDCTSIVENSNSMSELRNSLNAIVTERLELLRSEVPNGVVEVRTMVQQQDTSWFSEDTLFVVAVTVITVAVIAGVGYLIYSNYGSSSTPLEGLSNEDLENWEPVLRADGTINFEKEVARLHTLFESVRELSMKGAIDVKNLTRKIEKLSKNVKNLETWEASASMDIVASRELMDKLKIELAATKMISDQALLRAAELSGESGAKELAAEIIAIGTRKDASSALPKGSALIHGGVADPVDRLSRKVNNMYKNIKGTTDELNSRVDNFENMSLKAFEDAANFAKTMIRGAKAEILETDDFKALQTLLKSETIRKILREQYIEEAVKKIKK